MIGRHDSDFFIVTGNRIENSQIDGFEKKVKEINSWNHDSMRDIYSEKLGKSKYSEKGGAGLGLIDIYKRSGRKLKYSIEQIDDHLSFLSLHISVDNG